MSGAAFESAATRYDEVADSRLGRILRGRVQRRIDGFVGPGTRLLDLGCGTGIDARWALDRGARVVAVDASPAMIDVARGRVGSGAELIVADLNSPNWSEGIEGPFDVVLANFGVMSCLRDPARFGSQLEPLLGEGGHVVLVPMSRIVPWEQVAALVRLKFSTARRRLRSGSASAPEYDDLPVTYYTPRSLRVALGVSWKVAASEALGWVLPTYEQRGFIDRHPTMGASLARLDSAGGRLLGRFGFGDHVIVILCADGR